jgi:group I intron endonuclease
MQVFSIYCAKNKINGKCYIGFDSSWPNRMLEHKTNYKLYNRKFYDAIKKYGWDNFEWEVLYQSKEGNHCLNIMEPYFITEYNSYCEGYNMTFGGEGAYGFKHSDEYKINQSKKSLEQWKNQEFRNKQAKHLSELNKQQEKIYTFKNKVTGEKIKVTGLNEFCRKNDLWPSAMIKVHNGKRKCHKNWTSTV